MEEKQEDDIVLAKFINYMKEALYHKRINYFRNLNKIQEYEVSVQEVEDTIFKEPTDEEILNMNVLNQKEIYLLNLHYKHGLSYSEISKITQEKVSTLKQRRNRAILKLNRRNSDKWKLKQNFINY